MCESGSGGQSGCVIQRGVRNRIKALLLSQSSGQSGCVI